MREEYGHGGPSKKGKLLIGKDLTAYKFINQTKALSKGDMTLFDLMTSIIKELQLSILGSGVKISTKSSEKNPPNKIFQNLIHEVESFHENGFWDVVAGAKLYILFDDLDLSWNECISLRTIHTNCTGVECKIRESSRNIR